MKKPKRTRRYSRLKAPAGSFSDRYGPRLLRPEKPVRATDEADPWLKDFPSHGLPTLALLPHGIVIRRP